MRKQFHFWPATTGEHYDAWDVHRLIELSAGLPVESVALDSIGELDTDYWTDGRGVPQTVRQIVGHTRLILDVDTRYPVILGWDGRLMDGMHRIARALLEGRTHVAAVRLPATVEPDLRNVTFGDVPT